MKPNPGLKSTTKINTKRSTKNFNDGACIHIKF